MAERSKKSVSEPRLTVKYTKVFLKSRPNCFYQRVPAAVQIQGKDVGLHCPQPPRGKRGSVCRAAKTAMWLLSGLLNAETDEYWSTICKMPRCRRRGEAHTEYPIGASWARFDEFKLCVQSMLRTLTSSEAREHIVSVNFVCNAPY